MNAKNKIAYSVIVEGFGTMMNLWDATKHAPLF